MLVLAVGCVGALPAAADAGTVVIGGDAVVFSDPAGQDNRVDVDTGHTLSCAAAWCVEIEDDVGAPTSSDPRCSSDGLDTLTCSLNSSTAVVIDLGAGQDRLAAFTDPGDALTGRGGTGNDRLYSTTGPTTLEGGDGDDALYPDASPYSPSPVTPGPDRVSGGPGVDAVWYVNHPSAVRVSLDGVANDGGTDDVDNVLTDVENITGSRSSDVLSGDDAANVIEGREGDDQISGAGGNDTLTGEDNNDAIDGGPGNDQLTGSAGDDRLLGGPGVDSFNGDSVSLLYAGNDTIDAVDGVTDSVACGPGADLARVDVADRVANEAQNACETIQRSAAPEPRFAAIGPLALKGSTVRVKVTCRVADPVGCNGRLTLRTASKVRVGVRKRALTLGRASFTLDPGRSRTLRVKLSRTSRSVLRRAGTLHVRVIAASTRPKGLRAERKLTLRTRKR